MNIQEIIGETIKQWIEWWGYDDNFADIARFCDFLMRNYFKAKLDEEAKNKK